MIISWRRTFDATKIMATLDVNSNVKQVLKLS